MTKEELLEDISIFDDKDIIEKLNENKELRDWFLVELNVSLQNAERVTAGYKEMKCYKNAVTSLQIENQELKEKVKELVKYAYGTEMSLGEFKEFYKLATGKEYEPKKGLEVE